MDIREQKEWARFSHFAPLPGPGCFLFAMTTFRRHLLRGGREHQAASVSGRVWHWLPALACPGSSSFLAGLKSVGISVNSPFIKLPSVTSFGQTSCFLQDRDRDKQKRTRTKYCSPPPHTHTPRAPASLGHPERGGVYEAGTSQAERRNLHIFPPSLLPDERFGDQRAVPDD